ncbi:MAG TPA: hypothetical protein PLL72_06125, partial [Burkholderiaceae bacterium]|nr:hypothetical protein [Burkholderiaceae bacterium]
MSSALHLPSPARHPPRPLRRLGLAAACAGLLAACSTAPTAPSITQPAALPSTWAASVPVTTAPSAHAPALDRAALASWWRQFDDPLLGDLVEQALQANTDLAAARSRLLQARALRAS